MLEIAEFTVIDKPEYIKMRNDNRDETKLCLALKNLALDKSITLPLSYLDGRNFKSFRIYVVRMCKTMGFRACVVLKGGLLYCFRRPN